MKSFHHLFSIVEKYQLSKQRQMYNLMKAKYISNFCLDHEMNNELGLEGNYKQQQVK
jgi:hypothetical protein